MKILQLLPYFYPAWVYGGPVRVLYDISRELVKRGHEVAVYTSDAKDFNTRVTSNFGEVDGVKTYYFRNISMFLARRKVFVCPSMIPAVRKNIELFDIVHVHGYMSFQNLVLNHYLRKKPVPYVLQAHGALQTIGKARIPKRIYDPSIGRQILRNATALIALNCTEAHQYMRAGVPRKRIAIIPNGLDLSEYSNMPPKGRFKKKYGIDNDEKIVLFLGRIHKIKGIDILVRAFARVVEKLENVRLVIVGPNDGYLREIRGLIKALRIEHNVLITGPLYGRDKLEAYGDSDIYVLPSRYEIFGMSMLEAYSCGKPVVASKINGLKDLVVNGVTGLLFELGNTRGLATCICHLLSNGDEALEMGLRGKRFVKENFSIEEVTNKLESLYTEIVSSRSAEPRYDS